MNIHYTETTLAGTPCALYSAGTPRRLLLQPADGHDLERMQEEAETMAAAATDFMLVAIEIKDWMQELTPWPAPPTYGKQPFGDGAAQTLSTLLNGILPELPKAEQVILGGYSLAGFFALWAATQTTRFNAVVGASASVWHPHFLDYTLEHPLLSPRVYMSIGDKESKARNKLMASGRECMERLHAQLLSEGKDSELEINPGNHFQDTARRVAQGFLWAMGKCST